MSDEPRHRPRATMPSIVWALFGLLAIALFVLALGVLRPIGL
jgi:hypothetical protein